MLFRSYEDTPEKQQRFEREKSLFQSRHQAILAAGDPYYNKNLRLDTEDVIPMLVSHDTNGTQ